MNRRTIGATVATVLWLVAGIAWFSAHPESFAGLKANQIGDFLAGFFAPLAFLWIVVAYLQQGDELRQNTEALRLQEEELAAHVEEARRQSEFMERRLELERDAREREAEKAKSAIQPKFVSRGGSGNAERWEMKVANEGGGPARDITVTLDGEELPLPQSGYLDQGSQVKVIVPKDQGVGVLRFEYLDREGERREAEYRYNGHCDFRPILPGE